MGHFGASNFAFYIESIIRISRRTLNWAPMVSDLLAGEEAPSFFDSLPCGDNSAIEPGVGGGGGGVSELVYLLLESVCC